MIKLIKEDYQKIEKDELIQKICSLYKIFSYGDIHGDNVRYGTFVEELEDCLDIPYDDPDIDISSPDFYKRYEQRDLEKLYTRLLNKVDNKYIGIEEFVWLLQNSKKYTDISYSEDYISGVFDVCSLINKEYGLNLPTEL